MSSRYVNVGTNPAESVHSVTRARSFAERLLKVR